MGRSSFCWLMILLLLSVRIAAAHDYEDCCRYCKEVSDSCKEDGSADCDARYETCMEECPHQPLFKGKKNHGAAPDRGEPRTIIPEISDPKKLHELKQK